MKTVRVLEKAGVPLQSKTVNEISNANTQSVRKLADGVAAIQMSRTKTIPRRIKGAKEAATKTTTCQL